MSTMSSGSGHALSALKNSYVTTPRGRDDHRSRRRSGDMHTPVKSSAQPIFSDSFPVSGRHHDGRGHGEQENRTSNIHSATVIGLPSRDDKAKMWANFADIKRQLESVNDDDFYDKLQQLKEEHRQTLEFCEHLYNEKLKQDKAQLSKSQTMDYDKNVEYRHAKDYGHTRDYYHDQNKDHYNHTTPNDHYNHTMPKDPLQNCGQTNNLHETSTSLHKCTVNGDLDYNNKHNTSAEKCEPLFSRTDSRHHNDHVLDMSSKPPPATSSRTYDYHNRMLSNTVSTPIRPSSAPIEGYRYHSDPIENGEYTTSKHRVRSSTDLSDTDSETQQVGLISAKERLRRSMYNNGEYNSTMDKIDAMWDSFSIDRYAPRGGLKSSSSFDNLKNRISESEKWRHRITVPDEFNMMKREASKEVKKARSLVMHERDRDDQEAKEELECQKTFIARPVPAHVYMPLYNEIVEKKEARRQCIKEYSKQLLKSMERPFKFTKREEENKNRNRAKSAPTVRPDRSRKFKANPAPKQILDDSVNQRYLEEEEYRKIRKKMRQHQLLRESSMPPRMEASVKLKNQKAIDTKTVESLKKKRRSEFSPRINRDVPDYDDLYRRFQKEAYNRKKDVKATVTQPFNLSRGDQSDHRGSRERIMEEIERDDHTMKENRWPYTGSRASPRATPLGTVMTSSLDSIPYRSTDTHHKRSSANREKLNQLSHGNLDDIELERQRRMKDMKVRQGVKERTAALAEEYRPRKTIAEKIRDYHEEDAQRASQYRHGLKEMNDRVGQRPYLFEQTHQDSIKRSAEKKFSNALSRHSVGEDVIASRGSRSPGLDRSHGDRSYGSRSPDLRSYEQRSAIRDHSLDDAVTD